MARLPAWSVALPLTEAIPSVETVTGDGHAAIPEPASVQVKVTWADAPLFQPFAFGTGATAALIVGAVLSSSTETFAEAVLPATSVTLPLTGVVPSCADRYRRGAGRGQAGARRPSR